MTSEIVDKLLTTPFSSAEFRNILKIATSNEINLALVRLKKMSINKCKMEACQKALEKRLQKCGTQ